MGRITAFAIPLDTSMFSAQQIHPRVVTSWAMNAWARWIREHLAVGFRNLIAEHRVGFVVVGYGLTYRGQFGFFSDDDVRFEIGVEVHKDGQLLRCPIRVLTPSGETIADGHSVLRPVHLGDSAGSLAALGGRLPDSLAERFLAEERHSAGVARPTRDREQELVQHGELLETARRPIFVSRDRCEVADQWSFVETSHFASSAREEIAGASSDPRVQRAVAAKVARIDCELRRPMFVFDRGEIESSVYLLDGKQFWLHRIVSRIGTGHSHATIVEELEGSVVRA